MKFRSAATAVLITCSAIVVLGAAAIANRLFSNLTAAVEQSRFDSMEAILTFNMKGAQDKALARAEAMADLPRTREYVAAHDRAALLKEYRELFQTQHDKYGVDQMQFHLPPGTSLLRLQAPDKHSDDLTIFRHMVVSVNQDQVPRAGLELARTGPALFGVVPIRDPKGGHAGTFEVGIDVGAMIDGLKAAYGLELAFFVDEQQLHETAPDLGAAVYDEHNRAGKYLKYHSTNWELLRELVEAGDLTSVEEPVRYVREAQGTPYGIVLVPLRHNQGYPIGVMAVAVDFGPSRAAAGRSLVWQALVAVFGIVILAGVILVVLRGFLLAPLGVLNRRFAALAAGEPDPSAEPADALPEELQELQDVHDKLKERIGVPDQPKESSAEDDAS
jgi:methyl-accepting chemotaxis protein